MAVIQIPTSATNPHYTQTLTLSGVSYVLGLRYNTRMARWILDIADGSGNAIVQGLVMLQLRNLAGQYTTLQVPPGVLFCINTSDASAQPSLSSFLTDTQFLYYDGLG